MSGGAARRCIFANIFCLAVGQNRFGIPFWLVGEFTTHFRTYFSGDWDVHWGYDLDFDPWPFALLFLLLLFILWDEVVA